MESLLTQVQRTMNYSTHLYQMYELQHAALAPFKMMANISKTAHRHPLSPLAHTDYGRTIAAGAELLERVTHRYEKPFFGLDHTVINGKTVAVTEEILREKPFCRLVHFVRDAKIANQPKLLIVAPMSGHHATLLRGTVEGLLPHADIYITDWLDARNVPFHVGPWGLNDYIAYLLEFLHFLGPDVHVLAVCQPSVPVMAAVSLLSVRNGKGTPKSMTLIGGPIDTREAPTQVNQWAKKHDIDWFANHVVTRVPFQYKGFMRRVYPGFLQLSGFMAMNMERHMGEHMKFYQHLIKGDGESADAHKKFYNEYLAIADLPAEFYLETLEKVFQQHQLPKGELKFREEIVDPGAITKTALLTIEGELDDISGVGQTKAAHKLVKNLAKSKQHYHLQKGVGHYGLFNGRKYREHVMPVILDFMKEHG